MSLTVSGLKGLQVPKKPNLNLMKIWISSLISIKQIWICKSSNVYVLCIKANVKDKTIKLSYHKNDMFNELITIYIKDITKERINLKHLWEGR